MKILPPVEVEPGNLSSAMLFPQLSPLLRCPLCLQCLRAGESGWECDSCHHRYSAEREVHDFYVEPGHAVALDLAPYTEKFRSDAVARNYAENFNRSLRLRARTKRELKIVREFVGENPGAMALNIPCGGGRLSQPLQRAGTVLVEADTSPGQIDCNRRLYGDSPTTVWMLASAFKLPFADASVDTVVCVRLSHHLHESADRERLLGELLRVANRRVIFTFRNSHSVSALWRWLRGRPAYRMVMSVDDVADCAARHGAKLTRWRSVSRLGSRHTFALLLKQTSGPQVQQPRDVEDGETSAH